MNHPAEWESIHQSRAWGTYPDIHVVRQVKKFLAQQEWAEKFRLLARRDISGFKCPDALDIGCGAGANTGMMCDEGMSVYAFDLSETAIGHMCNRLGDRSFFPAKSTVEDFSPPHQFDFILDNFTLTYLEHPPWERILSWLKPGGWLVHASFELFPSGTPRAWAHQSPGHVVERHSSWVEGNAFTFAVRKYVKEEPQEEDLNLRNHKSRLIQRALDKTRGDQSAAAKMLGVDRKTVYQHLKASS